MKPGPLGDVEGGSQRWTHGHFHFHHVRVGLPQSPRLIMSFHSAMRVDAGAAVARCSTSIFGSTYHRQRA